MLIYAKPLFQLHLKVIHFNRVIDRLRNGLEWSFFAVFDGHGGDEVARTAADKLLPIFLNQKEVKDITNSIQYEPESIEKALRESFIELDAELHRLMKKYRRFAGSTCTACLITPGHLFTCNLGDSRTLIVRQETGSLYFTLVAYT